MKSLPQIAFVVLALAFPVHGDSPPLPESIIGDWNVRECMHKGHLLQTKKLTITSTRIEADKITLIDASGGEQHLRYELLRGDRGWAIDLYAEYGPLNGQLMPSRIELANGELRFFLPVNGDARKSRPLSLDSSENVNWVLLRLRRDKPEHK